MCVDLDGTLLHSDLLYESLLLLLKQNPLYLLLLPLWLLRGKAALKGEIARRITLNPATLPYNQALIAWLKEQPGERWLATATHQSLAQPIADYLGLFHGVIASDDQQNLSGKHKADRLIEQFGAQQFIYCGNATVDMAIWRHSAAAVVVNGTDSLTEQARAITPVSHTFPRRHGLVKPLLKALRPHQWVKNILLFLPLITSHQLLELSLLLDTALAFFAFSLCASSVYLLNDMLDLESDRSHPTKCRRPFAAGTLPLAIGLLLCPLLLLLAVALALLLPPLFMAVLLGYYLLTIAYSFGLKKVVLIDTIMLAALFTLRIIAGGAAGEITLSFWLLLFSVFLFFSLALVKRYAELDQQQRAGKLKAVGRGYHVDDLPLLYALGSAAGYLCVLVLALYINSPEVRQLYGQPEVIWLLCVVLLYWISRIWLITHRGEMHDDPIVFALKDRVSLITVAIAGALIGVAT
ncbi:UbiA family prenyltransferase [Ectothiorhodospiraceae bacterium BW-2]|nr:UbiA family prenyltransferase [Ectothiorhodospiraceae bacterium BW-2]